MTIWDSSVARDENAEPWQVFQGDKQGATNRKDTLHLKNNGGVGELQTQNVEKKRGEK